MRSFKFSGVTRCRISGKPITVDVPACDVLKFAARDVCDYADTAPAGSFVYVLADEFHRITPADAVRYPEGSPCYGGRKYRFEVHVRKLHKDSNPAIARLEFLKNGNVNQWVRLADDSEGCEVYAIKLNNLRAHAVLEVVNRHVEVGHVFCDVFVNDAYRGTVTGEWATRDEFGHYIKKDERSGKSHLQIEIDKLTADKGWDNWDW